MLRNTKHQKFTEHNDMGSMYTIDFNTNYSTSYGIRLI